MNATLLKIWISCVVIGYVLEAGLGALMGTTLTQQVSMPWVKPGPNMYLAFGLISIISSYAFAHIFLKGYEGKGMMEGIRYGFWVTMLVSIPANLGYGAMLPMGRRVPIEFIAIDFVTFITMGVVASMIAGQRGTAPARAIA